MSSELLNVNKSFANFVFQREQSLIQERLLLLLLHGALYIESQLNDSPYHVKGAQVSENIIHAILQFLTKH